MSWRRRRRAGRCYRKVPNCFAGSANSAERRNTRTIAGRYALKPVVEVEVIVSGPLIANDMPTLLDAAVEGLGLAQVPRPLAASAVEAGKLVGVLEQFAPMAPGVFLYHPGSRQMPPKLRAFIEHIRFRSADAARDTRTARRLGTAIARRA